MRDLRLIKFYSVNHQAAAFLQRLVAFQGVFNFFSHVRTKTVKGLRSIEKKDLRQCSACNH